MVKSAVIAFLAVTLLTESLFPNVEVGELVKVPELLEHYKNHRLETPDITFFEFLHLHYGDSQHAQRDAGHHQKLPFSKPNQHHVAIGVQAVQIPANVIASNGFAFLRKIEVVLYFENEITTLSTGVWQPPKLS